MDAYQRAVYDILSRLTHTVQLMYMAEMFKNNEHISDVEQSLDEIYKRLERMKNKNYEEVE